MKIGLALETTFDSDAGVQQYFKGLGRYLLSKGHDVKFLPTYSNEKGEFEGRIISLGTVFNPPMNTTSIPIGFWASTKKIKQTLQEEKFDVIHVGIPVSPFALARLIRHADCPLVGTYMIHTESPRQHLFLRLISSYPIKVERYIDYLTAPNQKTKNDALPVISGEYEIIPHAIEMASNRKMISPLKKFDDDNKNLMYFGRLEDRKGVHLLLQCLPEVIKEVPNTRLIIAGDGPMRSELEDMVTEMGIESNVCFEGYIDEKLKVRYFASADVCVYPATYGECFGIVLVETLSAGKIPLAFANEGYGSVLENLPEVLVENKNLAMLAEKIVHFLTDEKDRQKVEKKCKSEAKKFSWKSVGPKFEKIYRDLQ